jgi:hypothetical protein
VRDAETSIARARVCGTVTAVVRAFSHRALASSRDERPDVQTFRSIPALLSLARLAQRAQGAAVVVARVVVVVVARVVVARVVAVRIARSLPANVSRRRPYATPSADARFDSDDDGDARGGRRARGADDAERAGDTPRAAIARGAVRFRRYDGGQRPDALCRV